MINKVFSTLRCVCLKVNLSKTIPQAFYRQLKNVGFSGTSRSEYVISGLQQIPVTLRQCTISLADY